MNIILLNIWLAFILSISSGYSAVRARQTGDKGFNLACVMALALAAIALGILFLNGLLVVTTMDLIMCVVIIFTGYIAGIFITR